MKNATLILIEIFILSFLFSCVSATSKENSGENFFRDDETYQSPQKIKISIKARGFDKGFGIMMYTDLEDSNSVKYCSNGRYEQSHPQEGSDRLEISYDKLLKCPIMVLSYSTFKPYQVNESGAIKVIFIQTTDSNCKEKSLSNDLSPDVYTCPLNLLEKGNSTLNFINAQDGELNKSLLTFTWGFTVMALLKSNPTIYLAIVPTFAKGIAAYKKSILVRIE